MSANQARSWQQPNPHHMPSAEPKVKVKVRKTGWITKGEKVLYSLTAAIVVVTGVIVVSFSSATDTVNRDLQQLERSVSAQQVKNKSLMTEKGELSRPERIIERAKANGLKIQNTEVKQAEASNN